MKRLALLLVFAVATLFLSAPVLASAGPHLSPLALVQFQTFAHSVPAIVAFENHVDAALTEIETVIVGKRELPDTVVQLAPVAAVVDDFDVCELAASVPGAKRFGELLVQSADSAKRDALRPPPARAVPGAGVEV